jgi:fermentation-respiration switch protein FrsA (DUF1100 family)
MLRLLKLDFLHSLFLVVCFLAYFHSYCYAEIEVTEIEFLSDDAICRGLLFKPDSDAMANANGTPIVILGYGFAATIDSGLVSFAERFAKAGMYAMAFDYRHFGISDGYPRAVLSIEKELEDWASALDFARSLEVVDLERIAVWGSSLAGGHVVEVAVRDGGVAAVVSQVPMMNGAATVAATTPYRGPVQNALLIGLALKDLKQRKCPDYSPIYVKVADCPFMDLAMMPQPGAYQGYRSVVPATWSNRVAAGIGAEMGFYNPGQKADKLNCPILIQIGKNDIVTPPGPARAAARKAGCLATVKEYDIGHFDIYSGTDFEVGVSDQVEFLTDKLGG